MGDSSFGSSSIGCGICDVGSSSIGGGNGDGSFGGIGGCSPIRDRSCSPLGADFSGSLSIGSSGRVGLLAVGSSFSLPICGPSPIRGAKKGGVSSTWGTIARGGSPMRGGINGRIGTAGSLVIGG